MPFVHIVSQLFRIGSGHIDIASSASEELSRSRTFMKQTFHMLLKGYTFYTSIRFSFKVRTRYSI